MRRQLSSVVFVMDYLQLDFDGSRLSLYVWPVVGFDGEPARTLGDAGYRDALCGLIAHEVLAVEESHDVGLVVEFDIGRLQVQPHLSDLSGPEIAMFQADGADTTWMVWRPGEAPFEELGD